MIPRLAGAPMRRRDFITLIGGAATWPLAARAQPAGPMRRIGVLTGSIGGDRAEVGAFQQALDQLGWEDGRNVRIQYRWGSGNAVDTRRYSEELVALAPDVILVAGSSALAPLLRVTRSVPIVFVSIVDSAGSGFVESMVRPGGNASGFIQFEYSLSGKWLELLKEVAPNVSRAAVLRDPTITAGVGQFAVIQSVGSSVGVEAIPVNMNDAGEIERTVTGFARSPNLGLVVTASAFTLLHSDRIIALAARLALPAVYTRRLSPPAA